MAGTAAQALYHKRGDVVVTGTGLNASTTGQAHSAPFYCTRPKLVPASGTAPHCPSSPATQSLYQRLSYDVGLVVHMASVLIHRAHSDDDLSPLEVRLFHRHQARYHTHASATATARGVMHPGYDLSITAWLGLRSSLLDTISTLLDSAASCGLFSAKEIQAQAESELLDVLVGAPPESTGTGTRSTTGSWVNINPGDPSASGYSSSSGNNSDAPASKQFAHRMEALRQLAQLHHKEVANNVHEEAEGTPAEGGTLDVPLTRLVWLLRDLGDMSPIESRPDLVLLCLSRKGMRSTCYEHYCKPVYPSPWGTRRRVVVEVPSRSRSRVG